MTNELIELLRDPIWRIENLYKIKYKDGTVGKLKLNFIQKKFVKQRGKHRRNRILKSRQMGFTTFRCIELLDDAIWNRGRSNAIIAHERSAVTDIFQIVKRAYNSMIEELRPKAQYDSKNELYFQDIDSRIYVALKLRSGTVTDLHISEVAFIKDIQELNAGSKQTVGIEGSITEETTANGMNHFYKDYKYSKENWDNDDGIPQDLKYKTYFYPWYEFPEYSISDTKFLQGITKEELELKRKYKLTYGQLAWRRWKISELQNSELRSLSGLTPERLFQQEYPSNWQEAFLTTGNTFFDSEKVNQVETKQPVEVTQFGLQIYKKPDKTHRYVIGVDPSTGQGVDYSCVDVWDIDTLEQVAQLRDYVRPDILADYIKHTGQMYNNAYVGVENNQLSTVLELHKLYWNIYFTTSVDQKTQKRSRKLGFNTNAKTRPLILNKVKQLFEDGDLIINSGITKSEMISFIRKDSGKVEHEDGEHDDSILAMAIALHMREIKINSLL